MVEGARYHKIPCIIAFASFITHSNHQSCTLAQSLSGKYTGRYKAMIGAVGSLLRPTTDVICLACTSPVRDKYDNRSGGGCATQPQL